MSDVPPNSDPFQTSGEPSSPQPQVPSSPPAQPNVQSNQPYSAPQPAPSTDGTAIAVLALGVSSLLFIMACIGFVPGIVALALAPSARRNIAASNGRLGGLGLVKAGVICAWVTIALTVLAVIGMVVAIVLGYALDGSSTSSFSSIES